MVGETDEKWQETVRRALELEPDSVTIYQMELPFNTVYSKDILGNHVETPVADWPTKRGWVDYAFDQFAAAGYAVSSAYTMVRHPERVNFSYRDNLWRGSDLLATGIASFGHVSGMHYQNHPEWEKYCGALEAGELPLSRGLRITPEQALIREMILQLKRGYLQADYFQRKFGVDIVERWRSTWDEYASEDLATVEPGRIELTRAGLLRVDSLLPAFFEPQFRDVRYT
jgi:oxygen-independent coproporphyrinogen-3 oxidase